jgi:dGTPase
MSDSLFEPPDWLEREEEVLASYAMHTRKSRGRKHPEPPHAFRTLYQRDRDRIVHSTAFRRLMHKTQVLVNPGSDYHRTRLTHTLEVAQISRTISRQLGLNEDLTEAVALMHDLGHPPFGHAGESALDDRMNACAAADGRMVHGFEHNRHALRIVEMLEYRYADFPGLNLSFEVLQAQAMHSKRPEAPEVKPYLDGGRPLLEAQVVDAADSLAYNCHDVDDALMAGLITVEDVAEVPLWKQVAEQVRQRHPGIRAEQFQPAVIRALINWQVTDLLDCTRQNLRKERIRTVEDVRSCPRLLVGLGPQVRELRGGLEAFLLDRVYRHYRVRRMAIKGARIVQLLFDEFCSHPEELPDRYGQRAAEGPVEQAVCDYLAGMTDRYAQDEYLRLFQPNTLV